MPRLSAACGLPVFLLLLAGCDVSGRVESEIEAALPAALGPADAYRATVEGVSVRRGTAGRVAIVGERVAREDAPVIDRLEATLWGVAFDRAARRLSHADSARATARLLPADLAAYLGTQRGIADAEVALTPPDRAAVRFRGEVDGIRIPIGAEVSGRLRADAGRVRLDVERVSAAGLGLGGAMARRVEERINPVADLTDEDLALRVESVRVDGGVLVLEATGDPSGLRLGR